MTLTFSLVYLLNCFQDIKRDDARAMDDSINSPKTFVDLPHDLAHASFVGNISAASHDLRACALQRLDAANLSGNHILCRMRLQPLTPLLLLRQRGASYKHQLRFPLACKIVGNGKTNSAHAAGDQIYAFRAEPNL